MIQNLINGKWTLSQSQQIEKIYNPATGEVLAEVPLSTRHELDQAVESANQAFEQWKQVSIPRRAKILFQYHRLLIEHTDELAELITKENGKNRTEALGEVRRGIECIEHATSIPNLISGYQLPAVAAGLETGMYRYPIGVVGGITPFNFPMMVPCWMFPLAIACGNTFILKPSERTPLLANRLGELFIEAGLPAGVLNIVHGAHDVVNGLLEHPDIKAISFVGSQPVGEYVYKKGTAHLKRVQALTGAKNHSIVLEDANLDNATTQIINAAFGSAGERCMACSVVAVEENIADEFVSRLVRAANQLRIGNGLEEDVFLGPVIREAHKKRTIQYIETGVMEGAQLVRDGRKDQAVHEKGYFIGPTIFDEVNQEMKIWQDEIFAPVLSIVRVKSLQKAVSLINQSRFANGACIFTNTGSAVHYFREHIEAGMLGVNIGVPAPMAYFPFSGWKDSFYGDLHANGRDGVEFYTRKKVITTRWV
ncbi:methylmalonate-semialdehyde dehydrogenase [acylating] [Seinonella peptonophila]|uniref:Malonate-semialdehyde dehydrogenase n=1 Tax=Seinonella peptonophila TaxID=112248 RepID=A0A1M5A915_9BACL|nr:CoA-acylating methylmalonate-semialdehyde dehydrogenase [Seinonella peptonophila]SHF26516.1 methylmalonate-semialdehyde dehydrogenase [acylating] [Seinonella peptonophila]